MKRIYLKWKGFIWNEKDLHFEKHALKVNEKDLLFLKRFFKRKGFLLFFPLEKEMKWKENYFYQPIFWDITLDVWMSNCCFITHGIIVESVMKGGLPWIGKENGEPSAIVQDSTHHNENNCPWKCSRKELTWIAFPKQQKSLLAGARKC